MRSLDLQVLYMETINTPHSNTSRPWIVVATSPYLASGTSNCRCRHLSNWQRLTRDSLPDALGAARCTAPTHLTAHNATL